MREAPRTGTVCGNPLLQQIALDTPHHVLGNASVGHSVQLLLEQRLLFGRAEIPVAWHAHIVLMRDQIEHIFLQIGTRAANRMNLVSPNHLRQGNPQFGGAHGPGHGQKHFAPARQQLLPDPRGIAQGCGVEMLEMPFDELSDGSLMHGRVALQTALL